MATADVPDFLTVEEAARVLRIGRTAAYQQAHLWLDTGSEGLPVIRVGGSLRVPRAQAEEHYNVRITAIPPREHARGARVDASALSQDIPRARGGARKQRKAPKADQGGLPFAG